MLIVGWVVATALGAFLGSFFAKRGETAALKRDLETIRTTLAQTTRVSEDIKAEVAGLIARIAVTSSARTVLTRFVDEWNKAAGSDDRGPVGLAHPIGSRRGRASRRTPETSARHLGTILRTTPSVSSLYAQ